MMQGISLESSAFGANQFAVNVFVQPLYVPIPVVNLTYGYRQKTKENREWWNFDESLQEEIGKSLVSVINNAEETFFKKTENAVLFYEYYKSNKKATVGYFQDVVYSACYAGIKDSKSELVEFINFVKKKENLNNQGTQELLKRAELLLECESPQELLNKWILDTKKALKK